MKEGQEISIGRDVEVYKVILTEPNAATIQKIRDFNETEEINDLV
jgi:hypothetical protein